MTSPPPDLDALRTDGESEVFWAWHNLNSAIRGRFSSEAEQFQSAPTEAEKHLHPLVQAVADAEASATNAHLEAEVKRLTAVIGRFARNTHAR